MSEEKIYSVKQDARYDCVRTVRLDMLGHEVAILYNESLGHAGITVSCPGSFFAPRITRAGNAGFALCYDHAVIFESDMAAFEDAYKKASEFCGRAGPYIDDIVKRLERGQKL